MQSGKLTVTGEGESFIPLTARPREVVVVFAKDIEDVPCNPHHHHHHDRLKHRVEHEDEDREEHHKPGHHHHDRKFFLAIEWEVSGVREIDWFVLY
jgi:hypothetical protein